MVMTALFGTSKSRGQTNAAGFREHATSGLYGQAATAMLDRRFPTSQVEYLLVDARSREVIAERWPHPELPIAPGSLLKPFVALAYVRSQQDPSSNRPQVTTIRQGFPALVCHGKQDGCWRPKGHGQLSLEQAMAVSCNAYFLALARNVVGDPDALQGVTARYGLDTPPKNANPAMLIGVTPEWRVTPLALVRAYALLTAGANASGVDELDQIDREVLARLHDGMRMAAMAGGTAGKTGTHAGGVLAKTGTATCVPDPEGTNVEGFVKRDQCRINGDGLVVLAWPAESPRWVLLVRKRGTTGALATEVAGEMLTRLEETGLE